MLAKSESGYNTDCNSKSSSSSSAFHPSSARWQVYQEQPGNLEKTSAITGARASERANMVCEFAGWHHHRGGASGLEPTPGARPITLTSNITSPARGARLESMRNITWPGARKSRWKAQREGAHRTHSVIIARIPRLSRFPVVWPRRGFPSPENSHNVSQRVSQRI